jgi:hypothetical protein
MKLVIQRKFVLQRDHTPVSRDWHIPLAALTHLAEGLDGTLLLTVQTEKTLINLVCLRRLTVPLFERLSSLPLTNSKGKKPS